MRYEEIAERCIEHYRRAGYEVAARESLLQPSIRTSFLFSVGFVDVETIVREEFSGPPRFVLVQPCFRHFDMERVGDNLHLSLFEMGGALCAKGWSASSVLSELWSLLVGTFGLDSNRLHVTAFSGMQLGELILACDDESVNAWRGIGVPSNRIILRGGQNFWREGADSGHHRSGICGPHTEIFYDRGEDWGCQQEDCGVDCGCGRYIEVANTVFISHRQQLASHAHLNPLPIPLVEVALGMERLAMVLQGCPAICDTDALQPIRQAVEARIPQAHSFAGDATSRCATRVLCDHLRAMVYLMADGARPGGKGRGSIVRKLFRRLLSAAEQLGMDPLDPLDSFVDITTESARAEMRDHLLRARDSVLDSARREMAFLRRSPGPSAPLDCGAPPHGSLGRGQSGC
jgi:alanyl-tRNA synthetase